MQTATPKPRPVDPLIAAREELRARIAAAKTVADLKAILLEMVR